MTIKTAITSMLLIFLLSACGESDLTESYMVESPRIIAVKVTDPESVPGDEISLNLLLAGKTIDQDMTTSVRWYMFTEDGTREVTAPYNQAGILTLPDTLSDGGTDALDMTVYARINIQDQYYNAQKTLRVTQQPVGKNPEITTVDLCYLENNTIIQQAIQNGDSINLPEGTGNIALTANTAALSENANDTFLYRWHVSFSKTTNGKLYVYDDKDTIEELLGEDAKAAEFRQSVVYSLKGEENDGSFRYGTYDIYLVVYDNADDAKSTDEDRLGTDFIYFTVIL